MRTSGRSVRELGLRVVLSDRVEHLLDALVERARARRDPFEPLTVAVPSRLVERRAELAVARGLGIAANLTLTRLPAELEARVAAATRRRVLTSAFVEALVRDVLLTPERLEAPALAPVRAYVEGAGEGASRRASESRACALAARLTRLYATYTRDRPELVRSWIAREAVDAGSLAAWQGALLVEALAPFAGELADLAEGPAAIERSGRNAPLVVLGYSYLSRLEHDLLGAIARHAEVLVLGTTPCAEFWEDAHRRERDDETESSLLASWGTAAREHVAMLDRATEYDATRIFAESSEATRLSRVQASIRERRAVLGATGSDTDDSLVVVRAPSMRREVEVVAGEIWARVHRAARSDAPLRFPDVAVWVPPRARDEYLAHVESVFADAQHIPWSGLDLALRAESRVVDALARLCTLVAEGPSRARLSDVLTHPLVLAGLPGPPSDAAITALIARLGVYFGSNETELPPSYAAGTRAIDLAQAIERLALGQAMLGERSGDARFFERDGAAWLPEDDDLDDATPALVLLLRSLASDVLCARRASMTVAEWARFFVALGESYVVVDEAERAEHRRALFALRSLGGPMLEGGAELECAAACELAMNALDALPATHGASDRGVLVGTLAPHRASDHRLVFVLGLGEGRFPGREPDVGLDLRAGDRRAGEVTTEDRDRLALLEAVVAAREALVLSWVARDEQTGDELAPAHAVNELRAVVPDVPERRPPLRRDVALVEATGDRAIVSASSFPAAEREARARAAGDAERAHFADRATPLADLARELPPSDPRRTWLSLPAIPEAPRSEAGAVVRVTLHELRRFLDCATQAAARRAVGRDDDDAGGTDAEPFELDPLAHADLVRSIVLGAPIDPLLARGVAHGVFPLGAFGDRARSLATVDAARVRAQWRLRPRATTTTVVRFGGGREQDDASHACDPIALGTLPDGRAIELVGTTAPLAGGPDGEPLRFDLASLRVGERARVAQLRFALHGFVDHAALAASTNTARPRRALTLSPRDGTEVILAPVRPELARRWLAGLATELLREPQTAFMPIESVLRVAHLFTTGSGTLDRDLARSIETVRNKWEGGRSQYGPLRDVVKMPAPRAPASIAGRRFSIFFSHLGSRELVQPTKAVP
jgi:exodeoxyribonuclease V gamma subunit